MLSPYFPPHDISIRKYIEIREEVGINKDHNDLGSIWKVAS